MASPRFSAVSFTASSDVPAANAAHQIAAVIVVPALRHGDHPLVVGESDPEIVAGLLDASLLSLQLAVHEHQVPLPQIEPIVVVGQRPVLCREIDLHHGPPGRGLLRGSAQTSPDLWSDSEINPILNAMAFPSLFLCSHSAASGVRKNGLASVFSPGLLYAPAFSAV